jgi:hypothetical protein
MAAMEMMLMLAMRMLISMEISMVSMMETKLSRDLQKGNPAKRMKVRYRYLLRGPRSP